MIQEARQEEIGGKVRHIPSNKFVAKTL